MHAVIMMTSKIETT